MKLWRCVSWLTATCMCWQDEFTWILVNKNSSWYGKFLAPSSNFACLCRVGIAYEDHGQYKKSYQCFRQNYEIVNQVFGPYHLRSKRAQGVLNEPMYKRIALQEGHTPPERHWNSTPQYWPILFDRSRPDPLHVRDACSQNWCDVLRNHEHHNLFCLCLFICLAASSSHFTGLPLVYLFQLWF